jgi:hypothetical protein
VPHKASRLLQHLRRKGASVWTTTLPWSAERCDEAVRRGSHKSAHEDREFVFQEMADFCAQGYWAVLPYTVVRHWSNLRVSPLGAVPQRDRRPRLIVDYSFSAVNAETVPLAPSEAMQFGRALQRVMTRVVQAERRYGHVYLAKIDIADGFYRVWLQIADIPKLGVVLPTSPGQPALIAFPLTLPMGWVESPPYFTALTETACDLANQSLRARDERARRMGAHRLEAVAATPPPDTGGPKTGAAVRRMEHRAPPQGRPPVAAVDVYVDDFLLLAQTEAQKRDVMRASLHAIDAVFEPLSPQDPPHRKEPASVKKMLKGDACWATTKRILGWDLDTVAGTLNLPPHRIERLHELLDAISPPNRRVSVKTWHKLLGELRSMSPALPGSRGLFSILQAALSKADRNRVRITPQVWHMAEDFRAIATTLGNRPTRLRELIPTAPAYVGACDACQWGMGGVWFSTTGNPHTPIVWRQSFPLRVRQALVTYENPTGALSISDLELTALLAHKDVLAQHHPVAERTLWTATDNRAALSWSNKGSATATSARAYLLRLNSLHQRQHRYVATYNHIAGKANAMADDASRLWHLNDAELLTHFDRVYPQVSHWTMLTLAPSTNSALIGALFRQRPDHAFLRNASVPQAPPVASGTLSATALAWTPNSSRPTPSRCFKSSHNDSERVAPLPAVDPCGLETWRISSAVWGRRMPGWGPRTLA